MTTTDVRRAPDTPNLASLLLERLLVRAAARDPEAVRRLASHAVRVVAEGMSATLRGTGDRIEVSGGAEGPVEATLSGDLEALVTAPRRGILRPLLAGRLRARGRLSALRALRSVFATGAMGHGT
ncbi:MAG: hypothetical protein L0216_09320 [Planctomycetales bacterium]|nr:hypothetical protein [Planctomycetales bacterium]